MGRPRDWFWNSVTQKWELRGKSGVIARIGDAGIGFGDRGNELSRVLFLTGTTPIANLGTGGQIVATITNMTGVAAGDFVWATPKAALVDKVSIDSVRVATTNLVNVVLGNINDAAVASQSPVGWDVFAVRKGA